MLRLLALLLLIAGCSTPPMVDHEMGDAEVMMGPEASTEISVEESEGLICVTEKNDPATRTCVPRVEED